MSYAVAVGIYLLLFALGGILPLLFLDSGPLLRLIAFSVPGLLVVPRVAQRLSGGDSLLPETFRTSAGLLYGGGVALVWIGHVLFFGALVALMYFAAQGAMGLPLGIFMGWAMFPYMLGIVFVEIAFRQWSSGQPEQPWKTQRLSVWVVIGLLLAAHLVLGILGPNASNRPRDLLSFAEREALARGNGYAREVRRKAEAFYLAEGRMPCINDKYINVESLLKNVNRDYTRQLAIEILDCGRFIVTIKDPIDGLAGTELLFVASPGDSDAGQPLIWTCYSPNLKRIERHTNGNCVYDPGLAD